MGNYFGEIGDQVATELADRVEELERERRDGLVILSLDPKDIRRGPASVIA